jgi:hypothetical protein
MSIRTLLRYVPRCAAVALLALPANGAIQEGATRDASPTPVAYPEGYRTWAHVKSALMTSEHPNYEQSGGFHHIYANSHAMTGYRTGTFPQGSAVVFDWLEAQKGQGMLVEGSRRRIDVMVKDKRYTDTGGWGFERFIGDSRSDRAVKSAATECFACHNSRKTSDLVLSALRP